MSYPLRKKLLAIAESQVGTKETGRNTGKKVREYQAATTLPGTGWPWCAAFICWCIREWGKSPEVREALGLTEAGFERWRPKTAAAFGFIDWARAKGLKILSDDPDEVLHDGDIMVFDMSHLALVRTDSGNTIYTTEGNTGATGGRDGDGVWSKTRTRDQARCFIRLLS